jgi:PST family polysaccharide transporter
MIRRILPFLRHGVLAMSGNIANLIFSLGRVKLMAMFLGPVGMGVVSLYANFIELCSTLFGAGPGGALNRAIPRARSPQDERRIWNAALYLTVVPALIGAPFLVLALFALSPSIQGSVIVGVVLTVSLLFAALWRLLAGFLLGKRLSAKLFRSLFMGAVLPLAGAGLLAVAGVTEPLAYAALAPVLTLIGALGGETSGLFARTAWQQRPNRDEVAALLRVAGPIALTLLMMPAMWFYIRAVVEMRLGAEALGYLQPGFQIVIVLAGLFGNFAGITIVRWDQSEERPFSRRMRWLLAAACAIPAIMAVAAFVSRPLIELAIRVLFTRAFLPAADALPWFLLGEGFRMGAFLLNQTFISKGYNLWTIPPRIVTLAVIVGAVEFGFDHTLVEVAQAFALGHVGFFAISAAFWIAIQNRPSRDRLASAAPAAQ